jgi:hypothetical protein
MELSTAQAGSDFEPAPAGMHRAICYRFIDLGTQEIEWKGETKHQRKIMLSFELVDELEEFEHDGQKVKRPYSVHQRFTWSMHEKGNLRPFLESWRGKGFTDADMAAGGFDTKNLVGVPCYLNVIHNTNDGRTYANIKSANPLPKRDKEDMPKPHNPLTYLALQEDRFDWEVFNGLHDKLRGVIERSPEYRKIAGTGHDEPDANGGGQNDDMDDEIPF